MTALRAILDPWLGKAQYKQSEGRVTVVYRFESEGVQATRMRLKVEINTREHFTVLGYRRERVAVANPWFTGEAEVVTSGANAIGKTRSISPSQRFARFASRMAFRHAVSSLWIVESVTPSPRRWAM